MTGTISIDDVRVTIKRILVGHQKITDTLASREDISRILRYMIGGVFWSIMLIVVLVIFGVDFLKVVVPYLSVVLSFSFAFASAFARLKPSTTWALECAMRMPLPPPPADALIITG